MQETTEKKTRARGARAEKQAVFTDAQPEEKKQGASFTEEQVKAMIAEAVAKYAAEHKEKEESPVQTNGIVTMIWQAEVNDENQLMLGPNGKFGMITGKHATIAIPKQDFIGEFRTSTMQYYLKTRNLIVVDGLTEDERKVYGLDYEQGEYLEPAVYERLIEMGDRVIDIFPKLHPTWREMIATRFIDAYENKTLKCSRETLLELNKISRKDYANLPKGDIRRKGAFYSIIHAMNAEDEAGDME